MLSIYSALPGGFKALRRKNSCIIQYFSTCFIFVDSSNGDHQQLWKKYNLGILVSVNFE